MVAAGRHAGDGLTSPVETTSTRCHASSLPLHICVCARTNLPCCRTNKKEEDVSLQEPDHVTAFELYMQMVMRVFLQERRETNSRKRIAKREERQRLAWMRMGARGTRWHTATAKQKQTRFGHETTSFPSSFFLYHRSSNTRSPGTHTHTSALLLSLNPTPADPQGGGEPTQ